MLEKKDIIGYTTPEMAGVPSENIEKFIAILEDIGMALHDVVIARGNDIIFECYWAPYHKDYLHRMYSITKSYVAIAIGFLEQDGLISLDDPMEKFFPEELKAQPDQNQHRQTIRHMLMMSTAKPPRTWRGLRPDDWVKHYFSNPLEETKPSGTGWKYDSIGSHVLGAIVERVTGKRFIDYLREKLFSKIGVSEEAYCLKAPGGHSWMDAGLLCRPTDLLRTIRFRLNGGKWNGEQILNEEYVKAATSKQIDNTLPGAIPCKCQGYGYQIWKGVQDSFYFLGMHTQIALGVPGKDFILIFNGDCFDKYNAQTQTIFDSFFDLIVNAASDTPIPENEAAQQSLKEHTKDLKLITAKGEKHSPKEKLINNVTYKMDENPMDFSKLCFSFDGDKCRLIYTNATGDKELTFGMCRNEFGLFPEEGYAKEVASVYAPGNYYRCAASGAWIKEDTLHIIIQIIDTYLGSLHITVKFGDGDVDISIFKDGEDYMNEYEGDAHGRA